MSEVIPFIILKLTVADPYRQFYDYEREHVLDIVDILKVTEWQEGTAEEIDLYKQYIHSKIGSFEGCYRYVIVTKHEIDLHSRNRANKKYHELDLSVEAIAKFKREKKLQDELEKQQRINQEKEKMLRVKKAAIKKLQKLFPGATPDEIEDMYAKMGPNE